LADELVRREAAQDLQALGVVVGIDVQLQVRLELVVIVVVVALDRRVLVRAVHPFDLDRWSVDSRQAIVPSPVRTAGRSLRRGWFTSGQATRDGRSPGGSSGTDPIEDVDEGELAGVVARLAAVLAAVFASLDRATDRFLS